MSARGTTQVTRLLDTVLWALHEGMVASKKGQHISARKIEWSCCHPRGKSLNQYTVTVVLHLHKTSHRSLRREHNSGAVVTTLGVPFVLFHDVHICENSCQFEIYRSVSHLERYSLNSRNFRIDSRRYWRFGCYACWHS